MLVVLPGLPLSPLIILGSANVTATKLQPFIRCLHDRGLVDQGMALTRHNVLFASFNSLDRNKIQRSSSNMASKQ